jgi:squalene-hopene/tetraprenyl-beta-curcumene cyclase
LRHEVQHAIDRGLSWLLARQNAAGWWSTADHPAVTALVLSGFLGEPTERYRTNPPPALTNAIAYLVGSAQPDGSLHRGALINYNTAISMTALALADQPAHHDLLRRARAFLIRSQNDFGEPGKLDTPLDGGVGYGDKYEHSDLNNTLVALEALRATEHLTRDRLPAGASDLNWAAAIQFIQNCQNQPGANHQEWVSTDPKDRGGFVYDPDSSKAGGFTNASGKVALRSYGSISYAGLLSYIYADVKPSDPRAQAVMDWLRGNYSLEENPGMGPQGYFYYLHLMTKALTAARVDTLEVTGWRDELRQSSSKTNAGSPDPHPASAAPSSKIDWRREVAMRLINLQKADGSWQNDNGRWWEKDPNLVTAYAILSLEMIHRGM